MTDTELMTLEQVAKYLKLKPQTIYRWAQEGRIPAAKLGKEWRFRRSVLDQWIDTAIHVSKAGFDLMVNQSWLHLQGSAIERGAIEAMIERRWKEDDVPGNS